MFKDLGKTADRWRPLVGPYRKPLFARMKPRRSLPGQLFLPGIDEVEKHAARHALKSDEKALHEIICPNCGGTDFDEDGDCTGCWEPGIDPRRTAW